MTIDIKLVETRCFTRWHCHACGGNTEKVSVLAEGYYTNDPEGTDYTFRVCEECLASGDIDGRMRQQIDYLERRAQWLRTQIGQINVPTYEEWQAEDRRIQKRDWAEWEAEQGRQEHAARALGYPSLDAQRQNEESEAPF